MPETTHTTTRHPPLSVPPQTGGAAESLPASAEGAESPATAAVDALAVAWTMFRVYQDPRTQDAFRRAVATLGSLPAFPWALEVHSSGFRYGGRPVPARRQGAAALARAIFARGLALLGFSAPPTGDDLLHLFEVVSFQGSPAAETQHPAAALEAAGVFRITVLEHGRLTDSPDNLEQAEALVAPSEEPPGEAVYRADPSHRYLEEYRLLHERLRAGDFQGLQELVHGFTDEFFSLSHEQQTSLFEEFLSRREDQAFRLLLDQFSQDDLAELAQLLSPATHPLLAEYARIAAEEEGQSAAGGELVPVEQLVTDRISRMLRFGRAGLRRQVGETLRAQIPRETDNLRAAVGAASTLLALTDDTGFVSLSHTVAAKAAGALHRGDLAQGAEWAQTLMAAASTAEQKATARRAMEAALGPEILDRLVLSLIERGSLPSAVVTLVALFAVEPLVEQLALEQDKRRRRALVELVTAVARLRPGPVIRHLHDPRWYLVRNLVDALAHAGRPEAADGLRAACHHVDHRVRREARRSLPLLDPAAGSAAAVEGLHDPESSLRMQALALLRNMSDGEIDQPLADFVESRPPLEERLAAIEVLALRSTPQAHSALRHLARRRLWVSGDTRRTIDAARRALSGGRR